MPECVGCGAHVSAGFARVYGDRDGVVHACLECVSHGAVNTGVAAGLGAHGDAGGDGTG